MDALANGRRIASALTVIDDFSRANRTSRVDHGMGGGMTSRLLERAAQFRGYPLAIRTDQGPEFTSRAFMAWTGHAVYDICSTMPDAPRKTPTSRASTGKFRDEAPTSSGSNHWHRPGEKLPDGGATTS